MQCGLSSCRQWHKDGYLVELESGDFTNVGHICGKDFGEKFSIEKAAHDEKILRPRLISKLGLGKSHVEQTRSTVDDLAERVQVLVRRRKGLRDQFPALFAALSRRANQGKPELVEEVERTEDEIDDAMAMSPGQRREALKYRQVLRGRITGLPFVIAAATGVFELRARSAEFWDLQGLHAMGIDKLLAWERWLDDFDGQLEKAGRLATDGEAFFKESNLTQLALIAQDGREKREIARIKPLDLEQIPPDTAQAAAAQVRSLSRRERRARKFINWASKQDPN